MSRIKPKFTQLFINNDFVDGQDKKTLPIRDPSNEETIANVSVAGSKDVDKAVQYARKVFDDCCSSWRSMHTSERARLMLRFADLVEEHADELANLEATNIGRVRKTLPMDIIYFTQTLRYFAGEVDKVSGRTSSETQILGYTQLDPTGVVAFLNTWMAPIWCLGLTLGPCLASGCVIIIKPSELAPLSSLFISDLARQAGFPSGVIQCLTGGREVGEMLVRHPHIDKITTWASSPRVLRRIYQEMSTSTVKKTSMVAGGPCPKIICHDADLERAVEQTVQGGFFANGQIYIPSTRTYVHRDIYDEFSKRLQERVKKFKIGDPFDERNDEGAMISDKRLQCALDLLKSAQSEGAKILVGGSRLGNKGFFLQPTVIEGITESMNIFKEDCYAPIIGLIRFNDYSELRKRLQQPDYGCISNIYSESPETIYYVNRILKAGLTYVNNPLYCDPSIPFEGIRSFGTGPMLGKRALMSYLDTKTILVNFNRDLSFRQFSKGTGLGSIFSKEPTSSSNTQKPKRFQLFINNEYVDSFEGKTHPLNDPWNEEKITDVSWASTKDIDRALTLSKKSMEEEKWSSVSSQDRSTLLRRLADLLEDHADELANVESRNSGRGRKHCYADVMYSVKCLRYYAGFTDKLNGKELSFGEQMGIITTTKLLPIGVCALILSYSFPLLELIMKLAPCLASGSVAIVKPSERTPLSALFLGDLIKQSGFPPGVVQIINGGPEIGEYLAQHPLVDCISFTGSTETGKRLMACVSQSPVMKRLDLDMSGRCFNIVCQDADLDLAVENCIIGSFGGNQQTCLQSSRVFVHKDRYNDFVKKLHERVKTMRITNPLELHTDQGPIIDGAHFQRIMNLIKSGKDEAKLIIGGERSGNKGFFIQPTVFENVTDNMKIANEEILGPVMLLTKFSDYKEVINSINSQCCSHSTGIHTQSMETYQKLSQMIRTGVVYVNCYGFIDVSLPFGGIKQSGTSRELGKDGILGFTYNRCVSTYVGDIRGSASSSFQQQASKRHPMQQELI